MNPSDILNDLLNRFEKEADEGVEVEASYVNDFAAKGIKWMFESFQEAGKQT
jgi:hypothetical protein